MGIRFKCPNGHALHVKAFLAGKRGVCPKCGISVQIPAEQGLEAVGAHSSSAATASGATTGNVSAGATPSPVGHSLTSSQSIVISIADSPTPSSAAAPVPISGVAPQAVSPAEAPEMPAIGPPAASAAGNQPLIMTNPVESVSAAARYVVRRQKSRRLQIMLAIWLLIAVLVLGGVLFWVLSRGGPSAAWNLPLGADQGGTISNCANDERSGALAPARRGHVSGEISGIPTQSRGHGIHSHGVVCGAEINKSLQAMETNLS